MPTSATHTDPLDDAPAGAESRFRALERIHDPETTSRLQELGVGRGWRCLEVGAGGGSITRWLCSKVGPGGRVFAVDIDVRFVGAIRSANLEVARLDVTTEALPAGAFDLVHARALLSDLAAADRDAVLDRVVAALAPGGRLLWEEPGDAAGHDLARGLQRRGLVDIAVESEGTTGGAMVAVRGREGSHSNA